MRRQILLLLAEKHELPPIVTIVMAMIPPAILAANVIETLSVVGELPAVAMQMPRFVVGACIIIMPVLVGHQDGTDHAAPLEAGSAVEVGEIVACNCSCAGIGGGGG